MNRQFALFKCCHAFLRIQRFAGGNSCVRYAEASAVLSSRIGVADAKAGKTGTARRHGGSQRRGRVVKPGVRRGRRIAMRMSQRLRAGECRACVLGLEDSVSVVAARKFLLT